MKIIQIFQSYKKSPLWGGFKFECTHFHMIKLRRIDEHYIYFGELYEENKSLIAT